MPELFKAVRVTFLFWMLGSSLIARAQAPGGKKVYMITDMEGVGGIFDTELQCTPNKSPRWSESVKLLTGEINAAAEGLFEGGATEIVVWDGHWAGENLSTLDLDPKVKLFTGGVVSPTSIST